MKKISRVAQERIIGILTPIAALVIWQAASDLSLIDGRYVPSPLRIVVSSWEMIASGELWADLAVSLYRMAFGFAIGASLGVFVGMVMGLNRFVRAALDPIIAALYPIPIIAILPLVMLLLGIGDASKIAVIAIAVFFLSSINTMVGVLTIDRVHFDVAQNFGTPRHKLFLRVIMPAALPMIFSGLRISLGVSLIVLVGSEFVSSQSGIGYLIWASWETLVVEKMFVGIIVITVLGLLTTLFLKECEYRLMPWRRDARAGSP